MKISINKIFNEYNTKIANRLRVKPKNTFTDQILIMTEKFNPDVSYKIKVGSRYPKGISVTDCLTGASGIKKLENINLMPTKKNINDRN